MKTILRSLLILVTLSLGACQSSQIVEPLPIIKMSSGLSVDSCNAYNVARSAFKVEESYQSQRLSKAYLQCSIPAQIDVNEESESLIMQQVFYTMRPINLPLSINPKLVPNNVFANSGFELSTGELIYEGRSSTIKIEYKGSISPIKHLIWIHDEAKVGNYFAYYPAYLLLQNDGSFEFAPVYASSY